MDSQEENPCQKCLNKEHTIQEHRKLAKREYMRVYMHKYNEGKVSYRRWPQQRPSLN
jgi:hypothetical protein